MSFGPAYEGRLRSRRTLAAVAVLVAMASVASVAIAGTWSTRQRIAITARAGINGFVLTPLEVGEIRRDAGTTTWCCSTQRFRMRDGQKVDIDNRLSTLSGRRGTLVLWWRVEWIDAGNGYTVGTSTWRVVRGSGAYQGISGGGRGAASWLPRGPVTFRAEGFLRTGT